MRKSIITAALLAALSISAKAQMAKDIYIGKTSLESLDLKKVNYKRFPQSETIVINNISYTLDWFTREVIVEGNIYKMGNNPVQKLAERSVTVMFDGKTLTLYYSENFKECIDFQLK